MSLLKKVILSLFIIVSVNGFAQHIDMPRTLSVEGIGDVFVKPDIAKISFNLSKTNLDFKSAVSDLNADINKLTKALKKVGVDEKEIYSSSYSVNKEFKHNYKTNEKTFIGFKVSHIIFVESKSETKEINKIFNALLSSVNDLELRLNFTVKDVEKHKSQMLKNAISDAKFKAEIMAEASGVKLVKILKINYGNQPTLFTGVTSNVMLSKRSEMSAAPVMVDSFNPKDIKQSISVSIVWEIE